MERAHIRANQNSLHAFSDFLLETEILGTAYFDKLVHLQRMNAILAVFLKFLHAIKYKVGGVGLSVSTASEPCSGWSQRADSLYGRSSVCIAVP